ncbi:hypothetical protein [Streptomyces zhihengii]
MDELTLMRSSSQLERTNGRGGYRPRPAVLALPICETGSTDAPTLITRKAVFGMVLVGDAPACAQVRA